MKEVKHILVPSHGDGPITAQREREAADELAGKPKVIWWQIILPLSSESARRKLDLLRPGLDQLLDQAPKDGARVINNLCHILATRLGKANAQLNAQSHISAST